jgi:GT2 family glycosyltransferase
VNFALALAPYAWCKDAVRAPRLSVITPCYNAAPYIGATIRSALAQTLADLEVIVVDDGSTDESPAIVAAIDDPRVRLLHRTNAGPAAARNTGIAAARSDIIAFLDADDLALPDRMAVQLAALEAAPDLAVVASGYVWIDERDAEVPAFHSWQGDFDLNDLRQWLFDCPLVPSAVAMRRRAWEAVGGFDESFCGPEDWHFWLRLVLAGARMAWLKRVVARYRRLPTSLSSDGSRMVRECTRVLREIRRHPAFPPALDDDCTRAIAVRYLDGAKRQFATGWWREGRASLDDALHMDPSLLGGNPCRVELELLNVALDPLVRDPLALLETAFAYLPPRATVLRQRRDQTLHRFEIRRAHRCAQSGDIAGVLRHLLLATALRPEALLQPASWRTALAWTRRTRPPRMRHPSPGTAGGAGT